jgi:hypothetical protein
MNWIVAVTAVLLIVWVLVDAFAVMILPRRVKHTYLARLFARAAWTVWQTAGRLFSPGPWRRAYFGIYGPLALLALLAVWALCLILAFGLLYWSVGIPLTTKEEVSFGVYLYFSATTFFTLGFGDLVPAGTAGRALAAIEAGMGYGFLAVSISYLPVLYQAFSRREATISLLDARAGSPPTAGELLRRLGAARNVTGVGPCPFLAEWERWACELLETHLSYPVLAYYRSQHDNQSWVAALTCILDTSALLIAGVDGADSYQARLTFAMARHAAVDLALVTQTPPVPPQPDRLAEADLARLWSVLQQAGLKMHDQPAAAKALVELRGLYEPVVNALAIYFQLALPPLLPDRTPVDNWQTSPWMPRSPDLGGLPGASAQSDHFN